MLERALTHPGRVMLGAVVLLVGAVASVPFLGSEFMPQLDEGYLMVEAWRPPSTSLPAGRRQSPAEVERTLLTFPEVRSVVTNLGRPHEATETMALGEGDTYIMLKPKRDWRRRIAG